jgi:hypothetical protein
VATSTQLTVAGPTHMATLSALSQHAFVSGRHFSAENGSASLGR